MENWVDVVGYEGVYQVSDLGNVRSLDRVEVTKAGWKRFKKGKQLSSKRCGNGNRKYIGVSLGAGNYKLVHRLVAAAFLPNPDNLPVVNHLDEDTKNNCISNLEWTTYSGNSRHSFGKTFYLTDGEVVKIFESISDASVFVGCNNGNMSRLVNRIKYNHIKGWRLYEE